MHIERKLFLLLIQVISILFISVAEQTGGEA